MNIATLMLMFTSVSISIKGMLLQNVLLDITKQLCIKTWSRGFNDVKEKQKYFSI